MKNTYKRALLSAFLLSIPMLLILCQMQFGFINFTQVWVKRLFIESCFISISTGIYFYGKSGSKSIKYGVVSLLLLNLIGYLGGLGLNMLTTAGLDFEISISDSMWMLDAMGTEVTQWSLILKAVYSMIPGLVLVFMVIMFIAGDSPDEYQSVLIEFGIVIGVLAAYGIIGHYFGFGW